MIRVAALLSLLSLASCGTDDRARVGGTSRTDPLVLYSSTDTPIFAVVLADFKALHPEIVVRYVELDSRQAYERFRREPAHLRTRADIVLSSAMDLQVRLVNDGYALTLSRGDDAGALPAWAKWRDQALGFTFEPAVMVFNTRLMAGRPIPQSRAELAAAIRGDPAFWRRRIGTYDISRSSVGYLLASQDVRQSSDNGTLLQAFGEAGVCTYEQTSALLDEIQRGTLVGGYNLLGSYARRRATRGAGLTIIYPADYTLAVSRTAIVRRDTRHRAAAEAFVRYLLSARGQRVISRLSGLNAVRGGTAGSHDELKLVKGEIGRLRPISLGPGLLTYLDQRKRHHFLEQWAAAVLRPSGPTSAIACPHGAADGPS